MNKSVFPPVPKVLLEALEASFRDTVPAFQTLDTLDHLRHLQGQLSVIRFLRTQYEKQSKNILE